MSLSGYYSEDEAFVCQACWDIGWLVGENDIIIPCTECCQEVTLDDLEEQLNSTR